MNQRELINYWLFMLLVVPISACTSCEIAEGAYASFGGTEAFIQLDLDPNNAYKLKREVWIPGKYEKREEKRLFCQYVCEGKALALTLENSKGKAKMFNVGENPISIDPNSEALKFWMTQGDELEFMENEILYSNPDQK